MVRLRQGNRRRPDRREQIKGGFAGIGRLIWRGAPYVFLALVALGLPYLILQAYHHTLTSTYFSVEIINVEGFSHVDASQALEGAGVVRGINAFSFEPRRAEAHLMSAPFVRTAKVERRLPATLNVVVEEHDPVAVIVDEQFFLVDRFGEPFMGLDVQEWSDRFAHLPLISGIGVSDLGSDEGRQRLNQALEVARMYEEMGLDRHQPLSQIHVDSMMGISLVTEETGTEIRLGWGRWAERLERLKVVQTSLIDRGVDADYVLIDQEEDLSRVAVGQRLDPGKGEAGVKSP